MENTQNTELNQKYAKSQSTLIFLLLSFLTFGIYLVYWMYKQWAFFRDKDNLDILPPARAIFGLFYIHGLLNRINNLVKTKRIPESASLLLGWGFIVFMVLANTISRIEENIYFLIAMLFLILAIVCLFQPVEQLNKYWATEAPEYINNKLSTAEIIIMIVFGLIWILASIGLFAE